MIVLTAPDLPQLRCAYRCGMCSSIVKFEARDLGSRAMRFWQASQGWQVRTNCPCCQSFAVFSETPIDTGES